jgi:hypothetical protein
MASYEVFPVTVYGEPYGWYWQLLSLDGTRTGPAHGPFRSEQEAREDARAANPARPPRRRVKPFPGRPRPKPVR